MENYSFKIVSQDSLIVLYRVLNIFLRRKVEIGKLEMTKNKKGESIIDLQFVSSKPKEQALRNNIEKIVEVRKVSLQ